MKCQAILSFMIQTLKKLFYWWGKIVQKYPIAVILASLLLCGGLGYMFIFYEQIKENDQLYLPLNSEAFDDLNNIKDIFKNQPRSQVVFLSSKQNSNILTKQIFQSIYEFHQGLMEVSADGLKYKDLCYKLDEENDCDFQGHVLEFFEVERGEFDMDRISDDQQLIQLLNSGRGQPEFYPEGTQQYISVDYMFGQTTPKHITTYSDYTNNLQEAKALILSYQLGSKKDTSLYFEYQEKIEEYTRYFTKNNKHLQFYIYTHSAVKRQSEQILYKDIYLLYIGASLVVIWCFVVLGNLELTKSRMSMGIVGIFTVMMAYLQALGFGTLIGLKGNPFVQLLPFLLIGIGVDDMFVIVDSINRIDPTTPRDQKLSAILQLAGPSITLTSITNVFSFLMGSYTTIPALRTFCYFAAMGMFFDFLNQITIFCAILSLDIRRSQKGLGDFVGLCFCKPNSKICCKGKYIYDELGVPKKSLIKKFMRKCVGPVLVKFPVNVIILVFIFGLLGVSGYGISNLKFHFDYQDLIPEDTYIEQVIHFRDRYFDRQSPNIRFYTIKTEFSSQQTQQKLVELNQNISQCKGCDQNWVIKDSTNSWYEAFRGWVSINECSVEGLSVSLTSSSVIPEQYFYQCLNQWLLTNSGSKFENKVLFDSSHQKLKGAFISVLVSNQEDIEDKVQIMKDLRDIAQKGPGTTFPYDFFISVAEQAQVFLNEFTISLGLSGVCIFILVLIILGDILVTFYVFLVIAVLVITLLGFLQLSNLPFNMITLVNVIVSLGISVDYSAHVAYSFMNQKNLERKFRILDTLDDVGSSVMSAAISTFLAILPLLYSKFFVYKIYFIQWTQLVLFGVLYGLILLPIIFYFFGDTKSVITRIRKLSGIYNNNLFGLRISNQPTVKVVPGVQQIPQEKEQENFEVIPTSQNVGPDQDGEVGEEHLEFLNN